MQNDINSRKELNVVTDYSSEAKNQKTTKNQKTKPKNQKTFLKKVVFCQH
jgi:hypothetical protein